VFAIIVYTYDIYDTLDCTGDISEVEWVNYTNLESCDLYHDYLSFECEYVNATDCDNLPIFPFCMNNDSWINYWGVSSVKFDCWNQSKSMPCQDDPCNYIDDKDMCCTTNSSSTGNPTRFPTLSPAGTGENTGRNGSGSWLTIKVTDRVIMIAIFVPVVVCGTILVRRKCKKRNESYDFPDDEQGLEADDVKARTSSFRSVLNNTWNRTRELCELKRYLMKDMELGRQIASGSFSVVHILKLKESDSRNDMIVAGKILNQIKTADFLREVTLQLKASETCNNIVRVIGFVMQPKVILMEYHRNGSLAVALENDYNLHEVDSESEFPILCRLLFILELSKAVRHLHKIGIVHRDLALRNLLLSDDRKRVLLGDFGLARRVNMIRPGGNLTRTKIIPKTSPPESWAESTIGQISFGLKTDVWSIAMTIWEIVNKRPLGDDLTGMKHVIGTQAMIPKRLLRKDISIGESFTRKNELWTMMHACWFRIPKNRPQSWEVYEKIWNFVQFPRGAKNSDYVGGFDSSYGSSSLEKGLLDIKINDELQSSLTSSSSLLDSSNSFGEEVVTTKHNTFVEENKLEYLD